MMFLRPNTAPLDPDAKKLIGTLNAIGFTPWMRVSMIPNGFYAQISGTSGALTATGNFDFSNDGVTVAASDPNALTFSGNGQGANAPVQGLMTTTFNPWVPFKYVRFNLTALSGIGAQVSAFQMIGN